MMCGVVMVEWGVIVQLGDYHCSVMCSPNFCKLGNKKVTASLLQQARLSLASLAQEVISAMRARV